MSLCPRPINVGNITCSLPQGKACDYIHLFSLDDDVLCNYPVHWLCRCLLYMLTYISHTDPGGSYHLTACVNECPMLVPCNDVRKYNPSYECIIPHDCMSKMSVYCLSHAPMWRKYNPSFECIWSGYYYPMLRAVCKPSYCSGATFGLQRERGTMSLGMVHFP